MAGVQDRFGMSCVLSTVGLVALVANSLIVVRYGRRRVFIMTGMVICAVLQLIIAIVYQQRPGQPSTGQVLVALSCLYLGSYTGLVAAYAWVSGGEIPSQRLRSYTFGLASAVGFFFAWLTTFTAPYFINPDSLNWGPRYGYIWFPSAMVAAIWVYFFLPETKGRTLEEIDEMVSLAVYLPPIVHLCALSLATCVVVISSANNGHSVLPVQFEARLGARKFRKYQCVGVQAEGKKFEDDEVCTSCLPHRNRRVSYPRQPSTSLLTRQQPREIETVEEAEAKTIEASNKAV